MNPNIMNTQIFHLIKYDLTQKVTFMFILTITYVIMDNFLSFFRDKIDINYIEY